MKKYPVIIRTAFKIDYRCDKRVLEAEEMYENRNRNKVNSIIITELMNHWVELQRIFFGISRYKVTREERGMVYNLIKAGIDVSDIKVAMGAMVWEYRFIDWFRQRGLVPQIGTFVKKVNKYLSKVKKFKKIIQENVKVDKVIDFLGLNPLVEIENQRVPFGFKVIQEGDFVMSDIVKIEGRNFWYVGDDGIRRKGVAYCHYVYELDPVTKEKRFASDGVIIYVDNRNIDKYIDKWYGDFAMERPSIKEIVDNVKLGMLRIGEIPLKYRKEVRDKI